MFTALLELLIFLVALVGDDVRLEQWDAPTNTPYGWEAAAWADCQTPEVRCRIVFGRLLSFDDAFDSVTRYQAGDPVPIRTTHRLWTVYVLVHELGHIYEHRYGIEGFEYPEGWLDRLYWQGFARREYCEQPHEMFACFTAERPREALEWMRGQH